MEKKTRLAALLFGGVSAITILVMLNDSFALYQKKYYPAFLLAQKFALPLVLAGMALVFLAFFEPERLRKQSTVNGLRILFGIVFLLFTYFLTTLNPIDEPLAVLIVYATQWITTVGVTGFLLSLRSDSFTAA